MWKVLRVTGAVLLFLISGGLTAAKRIADWVGRSTFMEDAEALGPKGAKMFEWLADQPTLAFYVVPLILAGVGLALLFLPRPPKPDDKANAPTRRNADLPDEPYGPEHQALLDFVIDHLIPTCEAQFDLQEAIIERAKIPNQISKLAKNGLRHRYDVFGQGYAGFSGLSNSPADFIPPAELIEAMELVERGYAEFASRATGLAHALNLDLQSDPGLSGYFENWRVHHNKMIAAYEPIKKNRLLGYLYRPVRPSRWGGEVLRVIPSGFPERLGPPDKPKGMQP